MSVWIHHIETITPENVYAQDYASVKMQEWIENERLARMIRVLYKKSGIDTRYSVIRSFDDNLQGDFLPRDSSGKRRELSTAERNAIYTRESRRLAVELGRRALAAVPGIAEQDITHVVTASCTGFSNPGIDYHLVNDLGLPAQVERYNLGFMGCYAAFPALRMAQQFCAANPDAVVLVLCLELCTLHLQLNDREDTMLANSLFSDGAAAAIVSARQPAADCASYRFGDFRSALITDGVGDMAWTVGDFGFDIALSSYVPSIIGANIESAVAPLLAGAGVSRADIGHWAVHPGGKAIVDKVAASLDLAAPQLTPSREVLRRFGNMSSATVLFVLRDILHLAGAPSSEQVCAMAFGPGLTVEMGLLEAQRAAGTLPCDSSAVLTATAE